MAFTEKPPLPPPPDVRRFNPDGTPTQAQVDYETRLRQWQLRLIAAIP